MHIARHRLGLAFGLLLGFAAQALPVEVRFIAVTKGSLWRQENTAAPVLQTGNAYEFRAFIEAARPDAITSATLKWATPVSATRSLINHSTFWDYPELLASQSALNISHPNGTYSFVTQTALEGRKTNTVTLSADTYPIPLRAANFLEAQTVDSKADFTLRWDAAGTGANGFVQVVVKQGDAVAFRSASYPQAVGALNGSASSVVIPKNTLAEGQTYSVSLTIWRKVTEDLVGYPGVAAWAAYTRTTEFPLRTVFSTTDLLWYGLAKNQRYTQTSANPPSVNAAAPLEFIAFANATATANVNASTVRAANGVSLGALANANGSWRYAQSFSSEAEMNSRFASGTYLYVDTLHNGARSFALNLPVPGWPAAPQFGNFNEGNALDSTKAFVLRWNALAGGSASDFVQVRIRKGGTLALKSADHPFAPGALNGTSTTFTLPPGFLAPGESCEASVLFLKATATDSLTYPRVLGLCGYARETSATLRARGGNFPVPQMQKIRPVQNGLEFEFAAQAGRQYTVQGTTDFARWTDLVVTNAAADPFQIRVNRSGGVPWQFLRLLSY